ncbi:tetratricopeptide repeat protein [Silvanigrella aquatica]|uniref:Uncharacterized protein n=1 Tax=Silvanigrella aquatica TaxID=1915309 RepID=A0A1L4D299_9BACT|nr:tetratricopeptide repeat protein [Silvanigrella aquatica]APJ04333.1 hypothetical protein AXG55_10615 [Silvanigrella aquatica]
MTNHDEHKKNTKNHEHMHNSQEHGEHGDHHHHEHGEHCNHHHEHGEHGNHHHEHGEHGNHHHEHGEHGNHHHEHGEHCNHHHHEHINYQRHQYTEQELSNFNSQGLENLFQSINTLLEEENYGKAVPVLELVLSKIENSSDKNIENDNYVFDIKNHLALSYGIIGEHDKSLPLWKEIISQIEAQDDTEETLEAYYNAALSAEQAKNNTLFIDYLNKGLTIAVANDLKHWEATFEHEIGVSLFDANDLQAAEKKFIKAIEILEKINEEEGLVSSYYQLAFTLEKQQNIKKAREFYEKALKLSKEESIREFVEYERSLIEERLAHINNDQLQSKLLNF